MEAPKDQNQQNKTEDTNPIPPISYNKTETDVKDREKTSHTAQNNQSQRDNPQPFIVKIEKSKGWSKAEVISVFSILISGALFFMTIQTFKKTSRAVEISDSTFIANRKKDSVLNVKSIIRDSLDSIQRGRDYTRDTTNINIAQKSLQTQISSIKETQKEFEIESRPVIQVTNLKLDSLGIGVKTLIKFSVSNLGRFPAKILNSKGRLYFMENNIKNVIQSRDGFINTSYNVAISNAYDLPVTVTGVPLPENIYNNYVEGRGSFYLQGEYAYTSIATGETFLYRFTYKISNKTAFNVVGIQNEDIKLPKK